MAYNSFPYVNMHELNLDYLLNKSKEVQGKVDESAANVQRAKAEADRSTAQADASAASARNSQISATQSAGSAAQSAGSAAQSAESARIAAAAAGDPKTFTAAAQLTDTSKIYVYIGTTDTYTYGHWYYYAGGAWIDGGVYGTWTTDDALDPDSTNAVQNKVIYGAVNELKSDINLIDDAIGIVKTNVLGEHNYQYWNSETDTAVRTDIASGYASFNPIPVIPSRKYHIYGYQPSSRRTELLLFVDSDYKILSRFGGHETPVYFDADVYAPIGAVYALITVGTRTTGIIDNTKFELYSVQNIESLPSDVENLKQITNAESLKNKTVAIIGDSISTNGNPGSGEYANVPEIAIQAEDVGVQLSAYLTYYDVQAGLSLGGHTYTAEEIGNEVTFIPTLEDVGKIIGRPLNYNNASRRVWWEDAMDVLGFTPIPVCWSGASVTSHEGNEETYKTSYSWHDAQIRKCGIRTPGSMDRTPPDVIIIYRGTNDFSHSPYAKLTENYFDSTTWAYPDTDVVQSGYGFKEGLCVLIKKLRNAYPDAMVYLATLNIFKRVVYDRFPTRNGIGTLPQYNDAIREVAEYMGCNVISFDKDGITFENCYTGGYITDSETTPTHPNDKGHAVMGQQAIKDLQSTYNNMEV